MVSILQKCLGDVLWKRFFLKRERKLNEGRGAPQENLKMQEKAWTAGCVLSPSYPGCAEQVRNLAHIRLRAMFLLACLVADSRSERPECGEGVFLGSEGHLQPTSSPEPLRGPVLLKAHEIGSVLCSTGTHTEEEAKHAAEYAVLLTRGPWQPPS